MHRAAFVASRRNGLQSALQPFNVFPSFNFCKLQISSASFHTSNPLCRRETTVQKAERKARDYTHRKIDYDPGPFRWKMNRYAASSKNTPRPPPSEEPSPSDTPPTTPQLPENFSSTPRTASPQGPAPSSTPPDPPTQLPHLTSQSAVHQIRISHKRTTHRAAVAIGCVRFSNPDLPSLIQRHSLAKGDVLAVARIAGITAVKRTADLIPLAHAGVAVESCTVDLELAPAGEPCAVINPNGVAPRKAQIDELMRLPLSPHGGVRIRVAVQSTGKTGVEMEALCGVAGAALSVVDMCKAVDKYVVVDGMTVVGKKGGRSGAWGTFAAEHEERKQTTTGHAIPTRKERMHTDFSAEPATARRAEDYRTPRPGIKFLPEVENKDDDDNDNNNSNKKIKNTTTPTPLARRVFTVRPPLGVNMKPLHLSPQSSSTTTTTTRDPPPATPTRETAYIHYPRLTTAGEARALHDEKKDTRSARSARMALQLLQHRHDGEGGDRRESERERI